MKKFQWAKFLLLLAFGVTASAFLCYYLASSSPGRLQTLSIMAGSLTAGGLVVILYFGEFK